MLIKSIVRLLVVAAVLYGAGCTVEHADAPDSVIPENVMAVFHVAVDGDDEAEGSREHPFATLDRARDAVREINADMTADILVLVESGDYFLPEPFSLESRDSGSSGHRVIYRVNGEPGSARLIGGTLLTEWEPVQDGIFRARVERGHVFHTLYENGVRARKARYPNHEFDARFPLSGWRYLTAESGTGDTLVWQPGDLDDEVDALQSGEVNLVVWPWGYADWHKVTRRILSVDAEQRQIIVEDLGPTIGTGARYYVEGARAWLDTPGEFYLDTSSSWLYYWPRFGRPERQEIVAPHMTRIISLAGDSVDAPIRDVVIDGFALHFTDAFAHMEGTTLFPWSETSAAPHGALHLLYTEEVEIARNRILGSGMNGIFLERSNKRNHVHGNWIEDVGISGITLAYHRQSRQFPRDVNEGNLIENNRIHHLGSMAVDSAGITLWGGWDNVIRHNEIFDGARYGISVRGPFTQLRVNRREEGIRHTNRPLTENNIIEYSHLFRLGQDSGDTGALHMAGISSLTDHPVNVMRQLLIEDIRPHPSMRDLPPNGIFFDYTEGVTDQVLEDIEIRGTPSPFRTNRTDFRHTYNNCSWREGFDPARMAYDRIGLRDDFPVRFRGPEEVRALRVTEERDTDVRRQTVAWTWPDRPAQGVWIWAEGEADVEPVYVEAPASQVTLDRPESDRLVHWRVRTADEFGNLSQGVLVPAAEPLPPLSGFEAQGIPEGIRLDWEAPTDAVRTVRLTLLRSGLDAKEVDPGKAEYVIMGLPDHQAYDVQVELVDLDGHRWLSTVVRVAAGEQTPLPQDAWAWWSFDEPSVSEGQSLGDESGHGHTLFVGHPSVESVEGVRGRALRFDGATGYLRALDPMPLAIGTDDFSVSLWIRREASSVMSGRILDFGGGTRGEWEHWGMEQEDPVAVPGGFSLVGNDYALLALFRVGDRQYSVDNRGLDLTQAWHHVVVTVDRQGDMTLWLDGAPLNTARIAAMADRDLRPAALYYIARHGTLDHPNLYWTGAIDQLRWYRRVLDAAEIMALYEEGVR